MTTAQTRNRLSQSLRVGNMVRKRRWQMKHQDPATAGLLDSEIDRAIEAARKSLDESPRASIRRWLRALVIEKDLRARRRGGW